MWRLINVLAKKLKNVKILLIYGTVIKRLFESTLHTGCQKFKNYLRYSNFYKLDKSRMEEDTGI
jgi:hypothetical protein